MQKKQPSAAPRVFAIITAVTFLALFALAAAGYMADRGIRHGALDHKTALTADLLSNSLALPVWNFDRPQVERVLENAMEDPDILSVSVKFADDKGSFIGRTRGPQWKTVQMEREETPVGGQSSEERSIAFGNEKIGGVKLVSTARFAEARALRDLVLILGSAIAAGLMLALALSLLAWRKLVRPAWEMERYLVDVWTGQKDEADKRGVRFSWEMENLRLTLEKMAASYENRHQSHLKNEEALKANERQRVEEEVRKVREEHEKILSERTGGLQREKETLEADLETQRLMTEDLLKSKEELQGSVAELEGILTERTSELRRADDRLKDEIEGQTRARDEFFSSKEELSRALNERTEELKNTGEKLLAELTSRKRTEEELLKSRAELEASMAEKVSSLQSAHDQLSAELSERRGSEEGLMRSREELLRAKGELEQALAERTIELQDANERFRADLEERVRIEEALNREIAELRSFRDELVAHREQVERRMADIAATAQLSIDKLGTELKESRTAAEELGRAKSELEQELAAREGEMKNMEGRCLEPDAAAETGADVRRVVGLQPGQAWHKVLLVDESEERRALVLKMIAPLEFEMREEDNGEDAVWEYEAWHPTLVLIELGFNGVDGFEVIRRIRAGSGGKEVKILAMAEGISDDICRKVLESGADDIIANPFRDWMLFEKLKTLLGLEYIYSDEV